MSGSVWLAAGALAIDVNAPDRTAPLGDPLAPVGPLAGAVVVAAVPEVLARPVAGGGLLVHPDLVWSLLDPLSPRPADDLAPRALARALVAAPRVVAGTRPRAARRLRPPARDRTARSRPPDRGARPPGRGRQPLRRLVRTLAPRPGDRQRNAATRRR